MLSGAAFAGCARPALDEICPAVGPGDLVVTELRGPQTEDLDVFGQWIEVFNASGQTLDLEGLQIDVANLFGESIGRIIVREPGVVAGPGDYVVLGRFASGDEPAHVDYGFATDLDRNLNAGGVVDVFACGASIDRVVHGLVQTTQLPRAGTLSLDGAQPPDATRNDDDDAWCIDDRDPGDPSRPGVPGTPGEGNTICGQ